MSLIIVDDEFDRGVERMLDMSEELQEILEQYSTTIQDLMSDGIKDVAIDNVLIEKLKELGTYYKTMTETVKNIEDNTTQFLKEIDTADSFSF